MKSYRHIALISVLGTALIAPGAIGEKVSASVAPQSQPRRLPATVRPVRYEIDFQPDLERGAFQGKEQLSIVVSGGGADTILLHSRDLNISAVTIAQSGTTLACSIKPMLADQMIALTPPHHLAEGKYKLTLSFAGKMNDKLVGFYRSSFKDERGRTHRLGVTQMEPTDARRMFPCFDEPDFKASFKLTVKIAHGLSAVSNAPLVHMTPNQDGSTTNYFAATPRMSSYLVALVVGELEATAAKTVDGVPIRVWSVAGKKHLGLYSRDQAASILPYLTSYFAIAYPWSKLDLIAIPDFEAGAMENPGAITFRETLLLIDPATASSRAKRSASSVIAHEMSHLWFGDLVTMKWWDDLWLNEAFATWMSSRAIEKVHPDWDEWKSYCNDRSYSMETDSLQSTRAIHYDVRNPEQAHEMFDAITYQKGCAILRMLELFVGEPTFQKGVHNYLTKHSFANATTADLWDAIGTASGAPVRDVMQSWVHQPGYPLLSLQARPAGGYLATQVRFLETGIVKDDQSLWQVPVGLRQLTGPVAQNGQTAAQSYQLLAARDGDLPALGTAADALLFVNAGGAGYYRTCYPDSAYGELIQRAEQQLDPCERLSLLDDTWALTQAGELKLENYLNLVKSLKKDKDELIADKILDVIGYLDYFVEQPERPHFEKFIQEQLGSLMQQLGWQAAKGESQQRRMLRGRVLRMLGTLAADKQTIATARAELALLQKSQPGSIAGIDPDLISPITSIVAYNGDASAFQFFKQRYLQAKTPEEEHRNLSALAQFRLASLEAVVLDMSISSSVRTQDAPGLLAALLSRRDSNQRAWDFTRANWQRITHLYSEEMVPHLVSHAASFTTQKQYEETESFLKTHKVPSGESAVARTLERIKVNVRFKEHNQASFNQWLKSNFS